MQYNIIKNKIMDKNTDKPFSIDDIKDIKKRIEKSAKQAIYIEPRTKDELYKIKKQLQDEKFNVTQECSITCRAEYIEDCRCVGQLYVTNSNSNLYKTCKFRDA